MKKSTFIIALLLLTNILLFAQSGLKIKSGGAVTVNGNLTVTPGEFIPGTPFTDARDGHTYNTVVIGTQCWMAQNMNVGTRINVSGEQTDNYLIEKYCYNNDENNCNIYGGLYQWNEAMQYSTTEGVKGICPGGWHLPTDAEWTTLTLFLGGDLVAGGKLKEAGYTHWLSPNSGATNSSGFTALPGGFRDFNGGFGSLTASGTFWASNQNGTAGAWTWGVYSTYENIFRYSYYKTGGFSVRCIMD